MGALSFIQTIKNASNQNLQTLGGLDWRHWSGYSNNSSTRMTSGAGISNLTAIGSMSADGGSSSRTVSASNPSLSATTYGVFYGANGTTGWGERLTLDVGTSTRKAFLLIGQYSGAVKIDISLSDSSAAPISYTFSASSYYSTDDLLVEIDFAANSASQTATVDITCSTNLDFGRLYVQAVTLANAASGTTYNVSAAESITLTDASSNTLTLASSITESITSTESSSATGVLTRNITEAITTTESQSASLTVPASITESISTADSPSATIAAAAAITEAMSLSDSSSSSLGGNIYGVSITESISNAETSSAMLTAVAAVSEALTLNHTQTASALFAAQINEAINANATHPASMVAIGSAIESLALLDSPSSRLTASAGISEAISISDSPNGGLTRASAIAEAVTATESSSSISAQIYNVSITEPVTASEQITVSVIKKLAKRVIGGAISLRDGVGSLIKRNIGSSLTERDE